MSSTDILGYIPLFANLPAGERAELNQLLKTKSVAAHQPVVWLGERGDDFYIVHSGKVTVSAPDETGKEVTLSTLSSGQSLEKSRCWTAGRAPPRFAPPRIPRCLSCRARIS